MESAGSSLHHRPLSSAMRFGFFKHHIGNLYSQLSAGSSKVRWESPLLLHIYAAYRWPLQALSSINNIMRATGWLSTWSRAKAISPYKQGRSACSLGFLSADDQSPHAPFRSGEQIDQSVSCNLYPWRTGSSLNTGREQWCQMVVGKVLSLIWIHAVESDDRETFKSRQNICRLALLEGVMHPCMVYPLLNPKVWFGGVRYRWWRHIIRWTEVIIISRSPPKSIPILASFWKYTMTFNHGIRKSIFKINCRWCMARKVSTQCLRSGSWAVMLVILNCLIFPDLCCHLSFLVFSDFILSSRPVILSFRACLCLCGPVLSFRLLAPLPLSGLSVFPGLSGDCLGLVPCWPVIVMTLVREESGLSDRPVSCLLIDPGRWLTLGWLFSLTGLFLLSGNSSLFDLRFL